MAVDLQLLHSAEGEREVGSSNLATTVIFTPCITISVHLDRSPNTVVRKLHGPTQDYHMIFSKLGLMICS